jgi:hypothetical protein
MKPSRKATANVVARGLSAVSSTAIVTTGFTSCGSAPIVNRSCALTTETKKAESPPNTITGDSRTMTSRRASSVAASKPPPVTTANAGEGDSAEAVRTPAALPYEK